MEEGREASGSDAASVEARGVWMVASRGTPDRRLAGASAPFGDLLQTWLTAGPPAPHVRLAVRTGNGATDATLEALAPAFVAMLERLTVRQREVARLLLLEGRRRAQIAEELGISRPTVSVMVERARLGDLSAVAAALDAIFAVAAGSAPVSPR